MHTRTAALDDDELPFIDLGAPDFNYHSATVREARSRHWLARSDFGLLVIRYEDVAALLKDPRLHHGMPAYLRMHGVNDGPLVEWWTSAILGMDDDGAHTRLRRLVSKAFTPPAVERLRPYFRATAERLADAFPSDGRVEFMSAFAEPYPLEGICEMLGIPVARRRSFYGWAADLALFFSPHIAQPEGRARAEGAIRALNACADEVIAERREHPRDDLVSDLIAAEVDGDRLSVAELRSMITFLVFAGNDTTRNQLGLGMLAFTSLPGQWQQLVSNPQLLSNAVDEVMRLVPTISEIPRIVARTLTYRGMTFEPGTMLMLVSGSANVDESVFGEAPFDIEAERSEPHLTFGGGIHRCLGMWLAKAELHEAFGVLASRYAHVALDRRPTYKPNLGIAGPQTLPLRLSASMT